MPFIISWPAKIKPGQSEATVSQIDFLASFAKLVGVELAEGDAFDSRDTLDAFLGKDEKGLPFMLEEARGLALREGDWKYIEGKKAQLYDLSKDPSEQNNIIKDHPERAQSMRPRSSRSAKPKKHPQSQVIRPYSPLFQGPVAPCGRAFFV